jgi:ankyrin repeat protein
VELFALHYAAQFGASPEVVRLLVELVRPHALRERSGAEGVHSPCTSRPSTRRARASKSPRPGVCVLHRSGTTRPQAATPRCTLALALNSFEAVEPLAKACPEALQARDADGNTPLHVAAGIRCPLGVVQLLAATRPQALGERADNGYTPLNYAAERPWPGDITILSYLAAKGAGGAVRTETRTGGPRCTAPSSATCPLGRSRSSRPRESTRCDRLSQQLEEGAGRCTWRPATRALQLWTGSQRRSPTPSPVRMHVGGARFILPQGSLLWRSSSASPTSAPERWRLDPTAGGSPFTSQLHVVQYLATRSPAALAEGTDDGSLPLHIAARYARLDVVQYLATRSPGALEARSNDGCLPMHLAARYARLDVVQYLANRSPGALAEPMVPRCTSRPAAALPGPSGSLPPRSPEPSANGARTGAFRSTMPPAPTRRLTFCTFWPDDGPRQSDAPAQDRRLQPEPPPKHRSRSAGAFSLGRSVGTATKQRGLKV